MKVINLTLVVIALFIQCSLFAQKDELPVIKANSIMVDIKDDNVLKKNYWRIIPEYKLDVYATYSFTPVYNINGGEKLNPICVGLSFTPLN